jgi:phosphoribosylanthranilate isomerase
MLTQVYEISTIEEASAVSAIGVDHVGVLVGDGRFPRELPISAASDIGGAIVPPSKFSALFLTCDISLIASWARELNPSIVHLGASAEVLSPKDVASLKIIEELGQRAKQRLRQQGCSNVELKIANGYHGWSEHAPF